MIMSFESPQQGNSKQHMRPVLLGEMTNIFPAPCENMPLGHMQTAKAQISICISSHWSVFTFHLQNHLSQGTTKPTIRLVRPAKSQINLRTRTVWWSSLLITYAFGNILGPVVQSVVSLTSSLRVISLTVLADSIYNILIFFAEKMWVAFALQKLLTFFQQKISAYLRITLM